MTTHSPAPSPVSLVKAYALDPGATAAFRLPRQRLTRSGRVLGTGARHLLVQHRITERTGRSRLTVTRVPFSAVLPTR